jgi:hypothetical protein
MQGSLKYRATNRWAEFQVHKGTAMANVCYVIVQYI